jgi:YhcH/YjgK/YiaL family protein
MKRRAVVGLSAVGLSMIGLALIGLSLSAAPASAGEMKFVHHFIDKATNDAGGSWGQTLLADVDGDGDLDFITGQKNGPVLVYEFVAADKWVKHQIGDKSPSDVGASLADINRDQWPDVVLGGVWLENPGKGKSKEPARAGTPNEEPAQAGTTNVFAKPWARHVFDPNLRAVHDIVTAEIDGDPGIEIVTMSDQMDIRWYDVPADPTQPWTAHVIGKPVHAGLAVGDLDGDGDNDVVRSTTWFENQEKGTKWVEHQLHDQPWPNVPGSSFHDSTRALVVDIDDDGKMEVVETVGEVVDAVVAIFEPPADPKSGPWKMIVLPQSDQKRAPYHSLQIADFDADGDKDIFSGEMEWIPGALKPRSFIWENLGNGQWKEQMIFDQNLGVHEAVAGDVDRDGDVDLCSKPWNARKTNALGGGHHVDFLENQLRRPNYAAAFEFLRKPDLAKLPDGEYPIDGRRVYAIVQRPKAKGQAAQLEAHRRYIDIQYVVEGRDRIGLKPLAECKTVAVPYNEEKDIAFFGEKPNRWLDVGPGEYVTFGPNDAHAPLGGEGEVHKVIVKIAINP